MKQREEDKSKSKSTTSTAPLQLQQFQQQQQQNEQHTYDPLHDCYSSWRHRLDMHCSVLQVSNPDTTEQLDSKLLEQDPSTIDIPSRIASLDNITDSKEFTAELEQLAQHLVGLSQDSHSNYAAGICFDACIPRLFYFRRRDSEQKDESRFWEEMPDVSVENAVCEASLSDLFPVVHEAFLRPHGVHGDNSYVHFLWKIFPQRSVVRNYESMGKPPIFDNSESRWLIDRLILCTLLGGYKHADPTSRPPASVRLQLYSMFNRDRRFYRTRYTKGNNHHLQWQLTHESQLGVDADVVDAFISGLLQHCREVIMFAVREFLVYNIDDDPAMLQTARKMFNYDRFRSTVLSTANKIRGYVAKQMNAGTADATMTASKLIKHLRHVHPHVHGAPSEHSAEETKNEAGQSEEPAPKRQKRGRSTGSTRRGKLKSGRIAMTCYEWDLAAIVKAPTTQLRGLAFQKPADPITKAFDAVRNQIRRPVPWDKYSILPVRLFLNDKELIQLRDERQISYHSHDPPPDVQPEVVQGAPFEDTAKTGEAKTDACAMNWQVFDAQLLKCETQFIAPLHPSSVEFGQIKCWPWESASEWQTLLDRQMESSTTQVYVTETQMTARHSFVLYTWLTRHSEATTPTADIWNAFVEACPAFGVVRDARERLLKITQKYYPYQFTKDSWIFTINRFADQYPYAYAVVQTFVYMWKELSTMAVHSLPLDYREKQAAAIVETSVKQMPAFAAVAGSSQTLCVPSEMCDLWFCSVCSTIYSLLDDPHSPYKHQYRLGLREAVFDFETGETFCYRTVTNLHMHCQSQPLVRLPMLERLVQFGKMHLMLCPSCGVMMVFSPGDCSLIPGKGFSCSTCSAEWSRSLALRLPVDGDVKSVSQVVMQQPDSCYLCETVTTKLWYYGPQTCLCRRHHKPSLVRFITQQAMLVEEKQERDLLADAAWVREMIHKFKSDYLARTADARAKYNNVVKRRIRQYRGLNERR